MLGNSNNHLQLTYICLMKNFLEQTIQWYKQVVVKFEIRMDVGKTSINILQPSIAFDLHCYCMLAMYLFLLCENKWMDLMMNWGLSLH